MTVRAKLKDLAPGTVFNAGPIDVRVLEHFTDGRTLLIADTCIADRHFADQPFKTRPEKPAANPNDWRFSNLNRELNTEFLATFDQAEGPIRSKDILTADWSLADHEGGEGYGTIQAKIALLTQTMYEKYADQDLLELDDWWWLITPYASDAYYARSVNTDGSLYYNDAYYGNNGVRPAFFVESGITLSAEPDQVELCISALLSEIALSVGPEQVDSFVSALMAEYTTEQLIAISNQFVELAKRFAEESLRRITESQKTQEDGGDNEEDHF